MSKSKSLLTQPPVVSVEASQPFGRRSKKPTASAAEIDVPERQGKLSRLNDEQAIATLRESLDAGRIEVMLQPMVTLPQRKNSLV